MITPKQRIRELTEHFRPLAQEVVETLAFVKNVPGKSYTLPEFAEVRENAVARISEALVRASLVGALGQRDSVLKIIQDFHDMSLTFAPPQDEEVSDEQMRAVVSIYREAMTHTCKLLTETIQTELA